MRMFLIIAAFALLSTVAHGQTVSDLGRADAAFNTAMKEIQTRIAATRDKVCPNQPMPAVCRMDFGAALITVSTIVINETSVALNAVQGNKDALKTGRKKVEDGFADLTDQVERLAKKYKE